VSVTCSHWVFYLHLGFADSRLLPVARQVGPLVVPSVNSVAGWSDVR
jgi:hypothetical protein